MLYAQSGKSTGSPSRLGGNRESNSTSGTGFLGGFSFMEYELLFFTSVANEDRVDTIKKELTEILVASGGKILGDFTDIGKRKLAYPIKRNTHAFFSFVHFDLDDENKQNIPEINKLIGLNEKVMRHIIVRADEIEKPVSADQAAEKEKSETPPRGQAGEAKPAEKESKAGLSELDEKLSEILDNNP